MSDEKLYTIDELMEGKAPGSVKLTKPCAGHAFYVEPFFKDSTGNWVCRNWTGVMCVLKPNNRSWKLYTEPKKKKVLRPAVLREDDVFEKKAHQFSLSEFLYENEESARHDWPESFVCMAPDWYAVEVEE